MTRLSFLFLLLVFFSVGHGLQLGQVCGTEPEIGRYMFKKGRVVCETCDANEHWHDDELRCKACTGSMTNLLPNIFTSCKDERLYNDPIVSTPASNETALLATDNVTTAPNNEETFEAENISVGVSGSSEVIENSTFMSYWDNDINNASTPTPITNAKAIETVDSESVGDKTVLIVLLVVIPVAIVVLAVIIVVQCVLKRVSISSVPGADVEKAENDENESQNSLLPEAE